MSGKTIEDEESWRDIARRIWPVREWMSRHPRSADWLAVVTCVSIQVLSVKLSGRELSLPALGISAVLFWRRRLPFGTLIAAVAFSSVVSSIDFTGFRDFPFAFALYAVASLQGYRRGLFGYAVGVLLPVGTALMQCTITQARYSPTVFSPFALAALATGTAIRGHRQRHALLAELWKKRIEHAKTAERARIAADMHDVVAHSLSTMIALANGAASAWSKYPERSTRALHSLSQVGRTALVDMGHILRLLPCDDHVGSGDAEKNAGRESLEGLVEVFRSAGLPVQLTERGKLPANRPELQTTVFPIVQEGLTNALRYAHGAQYVEVEITIEKGRIDIAITDDAPIHDVTRVGSGRGLRGISARAAKYDGGSTAGPRPDGGWRTHAFLVVDDNGGTATHR